MFKTFNTPAMFVAIQGVLAFYVFGCSIGIAFEFRVGVFHTLPVYEHYMPFFIWIWLDVIWLIIW